MQHINCSYEYQGEETFSLYAISDLHLGNASCDKKLFETTINEVEKDDNAIVLFLGDLAECITPSDKRFCYEEIDPEFQSKISVLPTAYKDWLLERLSPISEKIIGMHSGNHEQALQRYAFRDLTAELAGALDTKYITASCFTKLQFSYPNNGGHVQSVTINSAHGHQSGRKTGGKVNAMEDFPAWIDAEILLRAHSHSLFATKTIRIQPNPRNTKVVEKEIIVGHTGSFFSTYNTDNSTYAEQQDYPPSKKGCLRIFITISKDKKSLSYMI
jgi:hypothetical protein